MTITVGLTVEPKDPKKTETKKPEPNKEQPKKAVK